MYVISVVIVKPGEGFPGTCMIAGSFTGLLVVIHAWLEALAMIDFFF